VAQLNDQSAPYKTLQQAIDAVFWALTSFQASGQATGNEQGIVFALPGLYGPQANGSGDVFPIRLRDRVHVQGLGARRCVVRFDPTGASKVSFRWPLGPACGAQRPSPPCLGPPTGGAHDIHANINTPEVIPSHVLFDGRSLVQGALFPANNASGVPPVWASGPDTTERIDGFTFQGGDVQLLFGNLEELMKYEINAQVTNCLFDMLDGWTPQGTTSQVAGPHFGIMMNKVFTKQPGMAGAYLEQRILIANNTFILAQYLGGLSTPTYQALSDAVAIIDVTDPSCFGAGGEEPDPDPTLRGLGNPVIMNNLFRTTPGGLAGLQMALLGLDLNDSLIDITLSPTPPTGNFRPTNAFATTRVVTAPGSATSSNCVFFSEPRAQTQVAPNGTWFGQGIYSPSTPSLTLPVPAVALWDGGAAGTDPGFVGEFLSDPQGGNAGSVRDWRLLPDSPLIDAGFGPTPGLWYIWRPGEPPTIPISVTDSACNLIQGFLWDGEEYGNPRTVGASIDIGFDEAHLYAVAGSWADDSNSHNDPTPLNAGAGQGQSTRHVIFPRLTNGVALAGATVQGFGVARQAPPAVPGGVPAWTQPPGTLAGPFVKTDPALPIYYRTRYISHTNAGGNNPAAGWTFALSVTPKSWPNPISPPNGQMLQFYEQLLVDVEPASPFFYYDMEFEVTRTDTTVLFGNLQTEYR
jgi:hypothetical protein